MTAWWAALQGWRDRRTLARRAIPDLLWNLTLARFPFVDLPDPEDAAALRRLATLFLAKKEFHGAQGLHLTDDMAVAIAAQACLLVLRLGLDAYDGFVGIVVHAGPVVAAREVMDDDGVVHHYDEELVGEAVDGGPVMLSWQEALDADPDDWICNAVLHEFAHVLDMANGHANGVPRLPTRELQDRWTAQFTEAYLSFCDDVDDDLDTVLDPYAAEAPDEFFAVACEVFFVSPRELQRAHPDVYDVLRDYFQQDPAARVTV